MKLNRFVQVNVTPRIRKMTTFFPYLTLMMERSMRMNGFVLKINFDVTVTCSDTEELAVKFN